LFVSLPRASRLRDLHLDLDGDSDIDLVGDAGATEISEALKVNTALTALNIELNSIGDAGATKISEALAVNTVLTALSFGYRYLTFNAGRAIGVSEAGATKIADALVVNTVLKTLNLGGPYNGGSRD